MMAAQAEWPVSFIAQKLFNLLIAEANFLHDVPDQANWIQREFEWMQAFLKDADAK